MITVTEIQCNSTVSVVFILTQSSIYKKTACVRGGQISGHYERFENHLKIYLRLFEKQCCCNFELELEKFTSILQECCDYNYSKL